MAAYSPSIELPVLSNLDDVPGWVAEHPDSVADGNAIDGFFMYEHGRQVAAIRGQLAIHMARAVAEDVCLVDVDEANGTKS
jgi:hypothetical protein